MLLFYDGPRADNFDFVSCNEFAKLTNVIPIIPKGDSFTKEELKHVKHDIIKGARK